MGFFDFFKGSKSKKTEEENVQEEVRIYAALNGTVKDISEVPDPTFAEKMLGDGVAILPNESGTIYAPVAGKLVQFFETGHAFTIETPEGVNVLVHCGLNTVELRGEGFVKIASEGDEVEIGTPIVKFDYDLITSRCPSIITPIVVLDSDEYTINKLKVGEQAKFADDLLMEVLL